MRACIISSSPNFGVFCEESLKYLVVVWSAKRRLKIICSQSNGDEKGWKACCKTRKHELEWMNNGSKFQKGLGWTCGENFNIRIDYPVMFITRSKLFLSIRQEQGAYLISPGKGRPLLAGSFFLPASFSVFCIGNCLEGLQEPSKSFPFDLHDYVYQTNSAQTCGLKPVSYIKASGGLEEAVLITSLFSQACCFSG